jgi:hypothetical protein
VSLNDWNPMAIDQEYIQREFDPPRTAIVSTFAQVRLANK